MGEENGALSVKPVPLGPETRIAGHGNSIVYLYSERKPDSREFYSIDEAGTITAYDWNDGREQRDSSLCAKGERLTSVTLNLASFRIAAARSDGLVTVCDATRFTVVSTFQSGDSGVVSIALGRDGQRVATAGGLSPEGADAKVWDVTTGKQVLSLAGHQGPVTCVAYSPDGRLLATAGYDGAIRIRNGESGQELRSIQAHEEWVTSLAFGPDGNHLASGSADGTVRIWDTTTGRATIEFTGQHNSLVTGLAWDPDGMYCISTSLDGGVIMWYSKKPPVQTVGQRVQESFQSISGELR